MNFNFEFQQQINKEFLLSKNNEETYMSFYLNLPIKKGLFINPLRADKKPTASFYRNNKGELIFKDFGTDFSGNFIKVVMEKYRLNYYKAIKKIASDFGYINSNENVVEYKVIQKKFNEKEPTIINVEIKEFSDSELKWWKEFGITKEILKKFHIYSCKTIFLNGKINSVSNDNVPIYGYFLGKKNHKELWRIYYPKRKNYRFLSNTSFDNVQGLKQLPKEGKLLVITKSMKDVACLYSMGINAIAPLSENQFISEELLNELKERFKYIIVFYDNDLPGITGLVRIKKQFPDLLYTFIPRKYKVKDISDFYKRYGKEKTKHLILEYIKWIKN